MAFKKIPKNLIISVKLLYKWLKFLPLLRLVIITGCLLSNLSHLIMRLLTIGLKWAMGFDMLCIDNLVVLHVVSSSMSRRLMTHSLRRPIRNSFLERVVMMPSLTRFPVNAGNRVAPRD